MSAAAVLASVAALSVATRNPGASVPATTQTLTPAPAPQQPPQGPRRWGSEAGRIAKRGWPIRRHPRKETFQLLFIAAVGLAAATLGWLTAGHHTFIARMNHTHAVAAAVLGYAAYKSVSELADAIKEKDVPFDEAIAWLLWPLKTGTPIAALAFLVANDTRSHVGGAWPWLTSAVGVALILLYVGATLRAGWVTSRPAYVPPTT